MSARDSLAVVILAAGMGTRMKSTRPKVMHPLAGRPLIHWLLETVEDLSPEKTVVVVGPGMDDLTNAVKPHTAVIQKDRRGTGDAVRAALPALEGFKGDVLILLGDMPLITLGTLEKLIETRRANEKFGLSVLGAEYDDPPAFGRLIQNIDGTLEKIVEHRDATDEEREIRLCNTGAFCVRADKLAGWVAKIGTNNAQKEYYITDLPVIAAADGFKTAVCVTQNEGEVYGVNSREDLAALEMMVQDELRAAAMENGATLMDPDSVYFSFDTELGQDVTVEPHVFFGPGVSVADNVTIHAFSHLEGVQVDSGAAIGPYARLRVGSKIGADVTIGNFIEVNRTEMKPGAKAKHLGYLGDAVIGEKSNIGAGTVIANYDGFDKNPTTLGKGVFIGSNATLIAPLTIGEGAIVAGGSTITDNIAPNALGLAREKQMVRDGWAEEFRKRKAKK